MILCRRKSCKWFDKDYEMIVYPPYAGYFTWYRSYHAMVADNADNLDYASKVDSRNMDQPLDPQ